jgi:hypothetical protein
VIAGCALAGCVAAPAGSGTPVVGIPVARDVADPMGAALGIRVGDCLAEANVFIGLPDLGDVDAAIQADGRSGGEFEISGMRFYLGPVEEAAEALGAIALFIGQRDDVWIRTGAAEARQLRSIDTPAGRRLWILANTASKRPCGIP